MALTKTQKEYIAKNASENTPLDLSLQLDVNIQRIYDYTKREGIKCKKFDRTPKITQADMQIVRENIGKINKDEIVAMCSVKKHVVEAFVKKVGLHWKKKTPGLTESEKSYILGNMNKKPAELFTKLKKLNPQINYQKIYAFHRKNKIETEELVVRTKAIKHELFDLKFFNPDLVGPSRYPYPSNIQFLQA